MKFLSSLLSLYSAVTTMAVAISSSDIAQSTNAMAPTMALDSPLDGYTVNGTRLGSALLKMVAQYTFRRTAQSILSQIQEVNPNFNSNQTARVIKRNQSKIICNVGGTGSINPDREKLQSNYLRSLGNGKCGVGAGPRKCVRVSCSNNAGVWFCNDNPFPIQPTCAYLADYVDAIINECMYGISEPCPFIGCIATNLWFVRGQQFDTDNYNVLIGAANC